MNAPQLPVRISLCKGLRGCTVCPLSSNANWQLHINPCPLCHPQSCCYSNWSAASQTFLSINLNAPRLPDWLFFSNDMYQLLPFYGDKFDHLSCAGRRG